MEVLHEHLCDLIAIAVFGNYKSLKMEDVLEVFFSVVQSII